MLSYVNPHMLGMFRALLCTDPIIASSICCTLPEVQNVSSHEGNTPLSLMSDVIQTWTERGLKALRASPGTADVVIPSSTTGVNKNRGTGRVEIARPSAVGDIERLGVGKAVPIPLPGESALLRRPHNILAPMVGVRRAH